MSFVQILTPKLPKPTAPYSLATLTERSRILWISGQVPNDADGNIVGKGDVEKQTVQVLENMKALVEQAGGSMRNIFKISFFLTDRAQLPKVMEVRRRYFFEPFPAATGLIVAGLGHPDWLVEIEAMAAL